MTLQQVRLTRHVWGAAWAVMTWRRASESTRLFPPPRLMSHSRILIVRHGETNENVQGILQGQLDTMLNEIGYEQAHKTGMALRHEPLSRIITSPLKRTLHTAEAIASFHPLSLIHI